MSRGIVVYMVYSFIDYTLDLFEQIWKTIHLLNINYLKK